MIIPEGLIYRLKCSGYISYHLPPKPAIELEGSVVGLSTREPKSNICREEVLLQTMVKLSRKYAYHDAA